MLGHYGPARHVYPDSTLLRHGDSGSCYYLPHHPVPPPTPGQEPKIPFIGPEDSEMALILIVDDSSFQRRAIRSLVRQAGHETEEAENGRAGLEKAAARKPDIILTDLLMPELGGLELLEALSEQGVAVPVIIITGNIQESVRQRCLELGAAAVVNKPVRQEELLPAIEKALGDAT